MPCHDSVISLMVSAVFSVKITSNPINSINLSTLAKTGLNVTSTLTDGDYEAFMINSNI